ncbi:MAG: hypothetical protein H6Q73_1845 [Firmicutes bacterium]|nr:hypothetical protein [Bacillota bacterium]
MKKSILITTVALAFSLASVCSASPLTDFSTGKASIDLNVRSCGDVDVSAESYSYTLDGKNDNFEGALTYGLGNNFAVQYRNTTGDSKTIGYYSLKTTSKAQEFNVLYKVNNNLEAFVGWTQAKAGISSYSMKLNGNDVNGYQIGVTGFATLSPKVNGYASIAAGNHITNYGVGVGYELSKNCEFNIGYKDTKYKDLSIVYAGDSYSGYDYELKGMTYGVTLKF